MIPNFKYIYHFLTAYISCNMRHSDYFLKGRQRFYDNVSAYTFKYIFQSST